MDDGKQWPWWRHIAYVVWVVGMIVVVLIALMQIPPGFSVLHWWTEGAQIPMPKETGDKFHWDDFVGRFFVWVGPHLIRIWNALFIHDIVRYTVTALLVGLTAGAGLDIWKWLTGKKVS